MKQFQMVLSCITSLILVAGTVPMEGCGTKGSPQAASSQQPVAATPAADQQVQPPQQAQQGQPAPADQIQPAAQVQLPEVNLTSDGLDELLAPVALYPDPVLAVMLQASVNPQEVMDGGNWLALDENQNLKEAALDQASTKAGFTPVMQALLHYPTVVDLMCSQFDWTKQLGAAYQGNPKSVLASVQRLRAQAVDNGALKSSSQMKVDVTQDQGQQVVELKPADPKVVYVPQYDPSQVYSTTTTTSPDGTTTTTTTGPAPTSSSSTVVVQQQQSGVSTGTAVMIGLLSFGAGIAVGAAINNNSYYYPAWGYGGVYYGHRPYYPPPYYPHYYGGWHGGYGYNRPVHYGNNNIYINNSNNYYNRFNNNNNLNANYKPRPVPYNDRPGSVSANNMGNRPGNKSGVNYRPANNGNVRPGGGNNASNIQRPAGGNNPAPSQRPATGNNVNNGQRPNVGNNGNPAQRPANGNNANNWKGQTTYQGNKNGANVQNRPATTPGNANAGNLNRVGTNQPSRNPSADRGFNQPGGTRPNTGNNSAARPSTGYPGASRPATSNPPASRPVSSNQPAARPAQQPAAKPSSPPGGAYGGASNAKTDRAASSRGRESMGAQPTKASGATRQAAPNQAASKKR